MFVTQNCKTFILGMYRDFISQYHGVAKYFHKHGFPWENFWGTGGEIMTPIVHLQRFLQLMVRFNITLYWYFSNSGIFYWQRLAKQLDFIRWVMITYTHTHIYMYIYIYIYKWWDAITHSWPKFNVGLVKPPLTYGNGWVNTSAIKT